MSDGYVRGGPLKRARDRQIVYVPREGFCLAVARRLLGLPEERFVRLVRELVYGEWVMHRNVQHVTLAGLRKLARDGGVPLSFRRFSDLPANAGRAVMASVPERDR